MPHHDRWLVFLGLAVACTATNRSAQAQKSILDPPLTREEIVAKHNALTRKLIKRRNYAGEDQIRNELFQVPEVGLDRISATEVRKSFVRNKSATQTPADMPPADLGLQTLQKLALERPEVAALPWQAALDRQLNYAEATLLQNNAMNLHVRLAQLPQKAIRDCNLEQLRTHIWGEKRKDGTWDKPDCLPAITQILQVQPAPVRQLLVEQLAKIPGDAASVALAQRAIFDLSQQVREQAVSALKSRPASEYQSVLLQGLRWPWRPVSENSAEALVQLSLKNLQPELEELLLEPDPTLPFVKADGDEQHLYVKEVVRMNHAQNCLLCHPASSNDRDRVRGVVPVPGSKLPTPRFVYYAHSAGDMVVVRADETMLRQDFSVMHQVGGTADNSPAERFDYFLRERRATPAETKLHAARTAGQPAGRFNFQRESIRFVLHELRPARPAVNSRAAIERLD
jgi:hypothetical protein